MTATLWVRGSALLSDLNGTLVDSTRYDGSDAVARAGVAVVLTELVRLGAPWAVVTSVGAADARAALEHAGLPFPSVLVTAEDVEQGKPSPEGYVLAAARLGIDVTRAVVVEDTRAGVAAGLASGATHVLSVTGRAPEPRDDRVLTFSFADVVDVRGGPDDVVLHLR